MKIGILTFHNAHNYGAVLQAYSLRTVLRKMGHECRIVNYKNKSIAKCYEYELKKKKISVLRWNKLINDVNWNCNLSYMQSDWSRQWERFERFIVDVLLEGKQDSADIVSIQDEGYGCLIVGSDQIWEGDLTGGLDKVYLLDFDLRGKKIAYAASCANARIRDADLGYFKHCLEGFTEISVREKELSEFIEDECGKSVPTVCDPCLLLEKGDFEALYVKEKQKDDYIFVYMVVENKEVMSVARELAKKHKCGLVVLHYYKKRLLRCREGEIHIADCRPSEFLNYMANARMILTNSFHGVCFSIIFEKTFYAVCTKNSRIESLLLQLNLQKQHITGATVTDKEIDYENVKVMLRKLRKDSYEYLYNAIKE